MIEISFWKVTIVLLVALIVLGPEQLPKLARGMGKLLGQVNKVLNNTQKNLNALSGEEEKNKIDRTKDN